MQAGLRAPFHAIGGDAMLRLDSLSLANLCKAYAAGARPSELVAAIYDRICSAAIGPAWIHLRPREEALRACAEIETRSAARQSLPLFGVPFGVKDNIDVAGMPTTAACPAFSYTPERSARSVELLLAAGGVCLGKTNLDQFATGLSGTRSPYGACGAVGNPLYVSGGSSSGSAVVVATGLVSFALGTDTGGSGRIPAGFNGIIGIKPTVGRISTRGLVPNCPTLDCVSVFALSIDDGMQVLTVIEGFDVDDQFSRPAVAPGHVGALRAVSLWGARTARPRVVWHAGMRPGLRGGVRAALSSRRSANRDRLCAVPGGGPDVIRRALDRRTACGARTVHQ